MCARFLLGTDGSRSDILQSLGIGASGLGVVQYSMELGFRADLRPLLRDRPLALAFVRRRSLAAWLLASV